MTEAASIEIPPTLREATADQPAARLALAAALAAGPTHAYLFAGPPGTGKRTAARAFAGEILAIGSADPDDARRRAVLDPSPHPDLVWLVPPGTQHLVEDVRERVIKGAAYRPFEGERRVFVIEAAEAMADESQNALLKTLEEPPEFVHLILLTAEPAALLETVTSRCQEVRFAPLSAQAVEERLGATQAPPRERAAAASLSGGDAARALYLLSPAGRELRARAEACARAARAGSASRRPWLALLGAAEEAGEKTGDEAPARSRGGRPARRARASDRGARSVTGAVRRVVSRHRRGGRGSAGAGDEPRPLRRVRRRCRGTHTRDCQARGRARARDAAQPAGQRGRGACGRGALLPRRGVAAASLLTGFIRAA